MLLQLLKSYIKRGFYYNTHITILSNPILDYNKLIRLW